MGRMLKVFVSGEAQEELGARYEVVDRYPAFVIVDASDDQAAELAANHLAEDITDQYAIPIGDALQSSIDASRPRITTRGTTAAHPDYKGARRLTPGPHHYLVQFIGPVKPEWLDAVREVEPTTRRSAGSPSCRSCAGRDTSLPRPGSRWPTPMSRRCREPSCCPTP